MRACLVYLLYRTLMLTWRVQISEPSEMQQRLLEKKPFILAHWHGDELALLQFMRRYNIATIVSTSRDGELMNSVASWLGAKTSRGSSTRGAVSALKGLIRLVRAGHNCSFAVDGPKGPIHKVKPGVFEVSRALEIPIFWAGVACDRALYFPKSWNKTFLPKPFAKIYVRWEGPLAPPLKHDDPRENSRLSFLEDSLHSARRRALVSIAEQHPGC
jgi:lysophospholipid acyltransferase (LPLAT)-like uncharacterized protein